ncbi:MAG: helix-turn-helix transcriptional regulator [Spirochaetes bacterium]|nr:helix-turn-helix transcriptional regulator [Spirochaetota bacterium]
MQDADFKKIREFIGDVKESDLKDVDSFVGINAAVFIPSTGNCRYSVQSNHVHPSYSFFICYGKSIRFFDGEKNVKAEPGILYGVPPFFSHHEIAEDTFIRFFALMIDRKYFDKEASFYSKTIDQTRQFSFEPPENFLPALKEYIAELSDTNRLNKELVKALECRITHMILRSLFGVISNAEKMSDRFEVDKAAEYINEKYSENISVRDIASVIALSPSHFSRIFKKETGLTPQEYLIRVRLDRAKSFLLRSRKSVTEIALQCGFSSSAHFSSSFIKRYGKTPSEFKKY